MRTNPDQVFGDGPVPTHLRRNIEEIVITWRGYVNEVLAEDSSQVFESEGNPMPSAEFTFWRKRLKNVESSIYKQLSDPRVKRMAFILEQSKSSYLQCLQSIFKDVVASVIKARDVCLHLLPLEKYFTEIEAESDYPLIEPKFNPMMHCIYLTWSRFKYYCKSTHIVTLFKELSNLILAVGTDYLDPRSLFQGDIEECFKWLVKGIDRTEKFLEVFEVFRSKVPVYFKGQEAVNWTFHEKLKKFKKSQE